MGIDTLPDVEESAEPSICALREPDLFQQEHPKKSWGSCDLNEKPKGVSTSSYDLPPKADPSAFPEHALNTNSDLTSQSHLLEPAQIAELFETDLKYVSSHRQCIMYLV